MKYLLKLTRDIQAMVTRPIEKFRWLLQWLPKCLKNSSQTVETSAPVSSLKIVGWTPTLIATFQAEGESEVTQSRYASSVISSVVIVETVLEKHLALKCPLR